MVHDEIEAKLISPAVSPTLTLALRPKAVNSIAELIKKKRVRGISKENCSGRVLKLLTQAFATPGETRILRRLWAEVEGWWKGGNNELHGRQSIHVT